MNRKENDYGKSIGEIITKYLPTNNYKKAIEIFTKYEIKLGNYHSRKKVSIDREFVCKNISPRAKDLTIRYMNIYEERNNK